LPKQATHEEVVSALKDEKIDVAEKKKKASKSERPLRQRKSKVKEAETPKKEVKKKKVAKEE
jgi:hypothetical protein